MIASIDTYLFFLINQALTNPLFDLLMPLLSDRGFLLALPPLLLAGVGMFAQHGIEHRKALLAALIIMATPVAAFFLADLVNDLFKVMISRPRPCHALDAVRLLARCPRSYSMPSGHAIASFAFAASFAILTRDRVSLFWRGYMLLLAASIAFSRIYIGVHYPADIAVGTLFGAGIAWMITLPVRRYLIPDSGPKNEQD